MTVKLIRGKTIGGVYYPPLEIVKGLSASQELRLVQAGDAAMVNNVVVVDGGRRMRVLMQQASVPAAPARPRRPCRPLRARWWWRWVDAHDGTGPCARTGPGPTARVNEPDGPGARCELGRRW